MVQPVFPVSAGGSQITAPGAGWTSSGIPTASSVDPSALEWLVRDQSLLIEYCRIPEFQMSASATGGITLSGTNSWTFTVPNLSRTYLRVKVTSTASIRRETGYYASGYYQPQKFEVMPELTDEFGNSYGNPSGASGVVLGPAGKIVTSQPGYARYHWSSVSGSYEYSAIDPTSSGYTGQSTVESTFVGYSYAPNMYMVSGPPSSVVEGGGWPSFYGATSPADAWNNPMATMIPELAEGYLNFSQQQVNERNRSINETFPDKPQSQMYKYLQMYGNYNVSAENITTLYDFVTQVAYKMMSGHYYCDDPVTGVRKRKCKEFWDFNQYDTDFQIKYGDSSQFGGLGEVALASVASNQMKYYSISFHDFS